MTFNIGNQSAGNINNVGRDQHITGGQQGVMVTPEAARQAVIDLRAGLRLAPLEQQTSAAAEAEVREIEAEIQKPEPDRPRAASSLERLTRLLLSAGSLASAGAALVQPLQTLAGWLGSLGGPILHLLPLLA
ncbi:hypothetical protein E0H75_20240 [Kribbella capetownensis]|uniref:Uncharacterized protein n=1 Tax=Kribbella capetownensis TaxID=1572659 RepID=A0A4R0JQZ0_9ACTN|nr:hypothetical protein [Kribbella capetownensis]TCC48900.1 hypothetical protein E0H75_20240 [Kribbella capetownensis]